jgi:MFS family permease
MAVRVLEGLISVGAYSAAPALIMATTAGERRSRAMAVWSTYTPVGFSLGLVMSGAFAGSDNWRGGYLVHLVLFGVLLATSWLLPRIPVIVSQTAPRAAGLFAAWGQPGPLRLALTFGILVVMGFGMSSVYPQWYARQHELTPGQASSILAVVNLAMIPAGFLAGSLLVRGWRDLTMLTVLLLVVMAVSVPLFMPDMFESVRLLAMVIWMLAQGALIAVVLAALPRVVADPRRGAGAAGLIAQLGALTTFITPMVWQPLLQRDLWMGFVAVIVAAAIAGWLLFPRHAAAQN